MFFRPDFLESVTLVLTLTRKDTEKQIQKRKRKISWTVLFDGSDLETRYITVAKALLIFCGNNCDEKHYQIQGHSVRKNVSVKIRCARQSKIPGESMSTVWPNGGCWTDYALQTSDFHRLSILDL